MFNLLANREAVRAGDYIFFGGTVGKNSAGELETTRNISTQTKLIIARFEKYLQKQGLDLRNMVLITVYLQDLHHYDEMNEAYAAAMPSPLPARKLIITPLVFPGAVVEMTGIAYAGEVQTLSF